MDADGSWWSPISGSAIRCSEIWGSSIVALTHAAMNWFDRSISGTSCEGSVASAPPAPAAAAAAFGTASFDTGVARADGLASALNDGGESSFLSAGLASVDLASDEASELAGRARPEAAVGGVGAGAVGAGLGTGFGAGAGLTAAGLGAAGAANLACAAGFGLGAATPLGASGFLAATGFDSLHFSRSSSSCLPVW